MPHKLYISKINNKFTASKIHVFEQHLQQDNWTVRLSLIALHMSMPLRPLSWNIPLMPSEQDASDAMFFGGPSVIDVYGHYFENVWTKLPEIWHTDLSYQRSGRFKFGCALSISLILMQSFLSEMGHILGFWPLCLKIHSIVQEVIGLNQRNVQRNSFIFHTWIHLCGPSGLQNILSHQRFLFTTL